MNDLDAGPDVPRMAQSLERELRAAGSPERAVHEKAYLKSSLEHAGASLPAIRGCAKSVYRAHPEFTGAEVLRLADELWSAPLFERRMAAVMLLDAYHDRFGPNELAEFERFIRDSHTWALLDGLATDAIARIVARAPLDRSVDAILRRWADDRDFWVRRAALLAHLRTLGRRGSFDGWSRFCEFADEMLDEREFFIRKAIGWVLREASKQRPEPVRAWVLPRLPRIAGVTLREAVRYLAPDDRAALLAAYREQPRTTRPRSPS